MKNDLMRMPWVPRYEKRKDFSRKIRDTEKQLDQYKAAGNWEEVSGANGVGDAANKCWLSYNISSGLNAELNNLINNLSGSYLDTPGSSDGWIKYTLYWKCFPS